MPTLDTELVTALKAAKTRPMFFALIPKGAGGKLLVDKKKIPAAEIAQAKKQCGGSTIYQGKCHGEEDGATLVFEVAKEPPDTLAAATKKIIKEDAGLIFKVVEFRVNVEAENESAEAESQETGAPTAASTPPVPPPIPPNAAALHVAERLKLLAPPLHQALATGKPQAEQAKLKMAEASASFRNKDFTQANLLLDQAEPLIKRALADSAKPSAPGGADAQAWHQQLAILEPQYQDALKGNVPDANKLRTLMTFATGKADAGEYAKGLAALKQLEPLLKQARTSTTAKDGALPAGKDDFFKEWAAARSALKAAIDKVANQLAKFAVAILETNEENLVWVAEEGLGQMVSALREDAITIDRATSKTPAKVLAQAKPAIDSLRRQLKSPQVRASDENNLGVTVTINRTIGQALKRLEDTLALV